MVILLALVLLSASQTRSETCKANSNGEFIFKVDYHAPALTGAFAVEGCKGSSPVLELRRGVTYTFVQHDVTNWMHPLGFAYYPDGAHGFGKFTEVPELEYPTPDDCDSDDFKCNPGDGVKQAPLYGIDGVYEDYNDWNNGVTSGLDVYEPSFKRPQDQWREHKYAVKLTIPNESKTKQIFYFCHLHSGMSGLMQVVEPHPNANQLLHPFDPQTYYPATSMFDQRCGTSGTGKYSDLKRYCPHGNFLCGRAKNPLFSRCMRAIDCAMNFEMSTVNHPNPLVVFMHQMIPHHINAVNMARIALKHSMEAAGVEDDSELDVPALMRDIVNTQNLQIQEMRRWLAQHGPPPTFCRANDKKKVVG